MRQVTVEEVRGARALDPSNLRIYASENDGECVVDAAPCGQVYLSDPCSRAGSFLVRVLETLKQRLNIALIPGGRIPRLVEVSFTGINARAAA